VVDDHLVERLGAGAAVQDQEAGRAAPDEHRQQGAAAALVGQAERELVALGPQGLDLGPDVAGREHAGGPAGRGQDLAADVQQQGPGPGHAGVGLQQGVQPGPLDQQPRQGLLDGPGPLQEHVLLVDQAREQGLGDGDERHLEGDLEHREAGAVGGLEDGRRGRLEGEPQAEPEGGQLGRGQLLDVGGLALGAAAHAQAGGEQHLAATQEPGRVLQLGDVRPADRPVQALLAGDQPQTEPVDGQQVGNGGGHGPPLYAETYNSVPVDCPPGHYPGARAG
jgi:hypothetical protein